MFTLDMYRNPSRGRIIGVSPITPGAYLGTIISGVTPSAFRNVQVLRNFLSESTNPCLGYVSILPTYQPNRSRTIVVNSNAIVKYMFQILKYKLIQNDGKLRTRRITPFVIVNSGGNNSNVMFNVISNAGDSIQSNLKESQSIEVLQSALTCLFRKRRALKPKFIFNLSE